MKIIIIISVSIVVSILIWVVVCTVAGHTEQLEQNAWLLYGLLFGLFVGTISGGST